MSKADTLNHLRNSSSYPTTPASEAQTRYANSILAKIFETHPHRRKTFLFEVWGIKSSSELTRGMASAIIDWSGAIKENGYQPSKESIIEANAIVANAYVKDGQQPLFGK